MKKLNTLCVVFLLLALMSCGGTGVETNSETNPDFNGEVILNLFSLGSDFPPAIVISDQAGLDSTAFVVSFNPVAVLPIDLATLALSTNFNIFDASAIAEAAGPVNLWIESPTLGFLLSATHVVAFNPTTGAFLMSRSLIDPINLVGALPLSNPCDYDGDGADDTQVGPGAFVPNFPADLAVHSGRLFVTLSNVCFTGGFELEYTSGLLFAFDLAPAPTILDPASPEVLVLTGFNATAITPLSDRLLVTTTGNNSLSGTTNTPETPSFLNAVDPVNFVLQDVLNLGLVLANFQPLAVSADESVAFVGSTAFSEFYQIDLNTFTTLRGAGNPIELFAEASDFISDQVISQDGTRLWVSSFDRSAIRGIDLSQADLPVLPDVLSFAFESNPGVTGAGPIALRPGVPGVDFTGADLWVLTGVPGTLSAARTY